MALFHFCNRIIMDSYTNNDVLCFPQDINKDSYTNTFRSINKEHNKRSISHKKTWSITKGRC